jgi:hypothetical protein
MAVAVCVDNTGKAANSLDEEVDAASLARRAFRQLDRVESTQDACQRFEVLLLEHLNLDARCKWLYAEM